MARTKIDWTRPLTNDAGLVCGVEIDGAVSHDIFDASEWPGNEDDAQKLANLIAAAPALLAALSNARRAMIVSVTGISDGLTIHDIRGWIAEADSAISRAEGN